MTSMVSGGSVLSTFPDFDMSITQDIAPGYLSDTTTGASVNDSMVDRAEMATSNNFQRMRSSAFA